MEIIKKNIYKRGNSKIKVFSLKFCFKKKLNKINLIEKLPNETELLRKIQFFFKFSLSDCDMYSVYYTYTYIYILLYNWYN